MLTRCQGAPCGGNNPWHGKNGNRLAIYADMMRVPKGEEFPRKEYVEAMQAYVNGDR